MNDRIMAVLFVLALTICSAGMLRGQEEINYDETPAQWYEKPGRNNVVHAKDLPDHLGDDNRLWHVELHGRRFFNIITIDGDRVYCGMQSLNLPERIKNPRGNSMLCLDLNTGETIWQKELGQGGGYGLDPVPLIEGDLIYQQSGTKAVCVNKYDGEVLWETNVKGRYHKGLHGTHTSGVILGDYWWLATGHASGTDDIQNWVANALEHPFHPNVVVLNKHSGELVAQDDVPIGYHQHGSWCALSTAEVDGRQLVFWGDAHGFVHAWEAPDEFPEGEVTSLNHVWKIDANPKSYRYMEDGGTMMYTAWGGPGEIKGKGWGEIIGAVVYHEGLIYVAIGRDVAYSPKQGKRRVGEGALTVIDPGGEEPTKVWTNTDIGRTFSAPSVLEDRIIISDHSGYVTAIDRESGETLWRGDIEAPVWNYWHVVGDGKVYCMNELRGFNIFAVEDGEKLYSAQMDGQNNPSPGLTHGRLIIGTSRSVDCYAGPEYLKKHKPDQVVESDQIRTGDALDEPVEKGGH